MRIRIAAVISGLLLVVGSVFGLGAPAQAHTSGASYGAMYHPETLSIIDCTSALWNHTGRSAQGIWQKAAEQRFGATHLRLAFTNASSSNCRAAQDEECDYRNTCMVIRSYSGPHQGRYKVTYHSHTLCQVSVNRWNVSSPTVGDEIARIKYMRAAVGRCLGMPVRHSGVSVMYTGGGRGAGPADVYLLGSFYGSRGGGGSSWIAAR